MVVRDGLTTKLSGPASGPSETEPKPVRRTLNVLDNEIFQTMAETVRRLIAIALNTKERNADAASELRATDQRMLGATPALLRA